ncbi:MAG: glycosyltransferase family 39 protein, partial [Lentisphaeria bacterium]|nr:glycosyltransferase family 39 protein [Lentisphaeria bacterium]
MVKLSLKPTQILQISALFLFVLLITASAWITDDAYHGFSMSRNLVSGNGFVYNIGERVNASTMPLMSLVQALFFWVSGNMFWSGIFSGLIFSTAAAALVLFCFCRTNLEVIFAFVLLCGSKAFISFTTSGLENPLLFFLIALFVLLCKKIEDQPQGVCSPKDFFLMGLLGSLILLSRMDNVLYLFPVGIYYFFMKRSKDSCFLKHFCFGLAGCIPFFAWIIFSTIYYGFPFPNTAYAKLGTDIYMSEYFWHGIYYFFQSFVDSPVTLVWILFMLFLPIFRKRLVPSLFSLGMLIYLVYLLRIGGDFMLGRHFTVAYFIGIC